MKKLLICVLFAATACGATIEPGHRGLLFNPRSGGLQHEVLPPGRVYTGFFGRLEDFDVTYSTRKEEITTTSAEGLRLDLRISLIFRPVIAELYELDTEIGPSYYEEVVGPEFRSAARGVFMRHSYLDLQKQNEAVENEIETDLRRRISGKHIEVSSVTLESLSYAPEISRAVQEKLVGEQDTARQKVILDNEALRRKLELEHEAERERMKAEADLREAERQVGVAKAQAELGRIKAESEALIRVTKAKADAEAKRAEAGALTPLVVMMRAYEALAELGKSGATIYLGDFSHVPAFLFPKNSAFMPAFDPKGAPQKK